LLNEEVYIFNESTMCISLEVAKVPWLLKCYILNIVFPKVTKKTTMCTIFLPANIVKSSLFVGY